MHGRQALFMAMILSMVLPAGETLADSTSTFEQGGVAQQTAQQNQNMMGQGTMGEGMMGGGMLRMPQMDPARGRKLFASKGCVVCHSINGVGGTDAPALDAATMPQMMSPFDFTAKMWRGAEAMISMQREELGEQITFTGDELADIIAFVHHQEEQAKFSEQDIPPQIEDLMHHMEMEEDQSEEHEKEHETDEHTE